MAKEVVACHWRPLKRTSLLLSLITHTISHESSARIPGRKPSGRTSVLSLRTALEALDSLFQRLCGEMKIRALAEFENQGGLNWLEQLQISHPNHLVYCLARDCLESHFKDRIVIIDDLN